MENPEKLCRAFVRALGQLPEEAMKEAGAMLTPESLSAMGTITAAWLGTQGIPVLGQAVDAGLLLLGVAMAAVQTAMVKDSLWNYVNYATAAKDEEALNRAASHLARAVAVVGVSVVTFILMKKVSVKLRTQPGALGPPPGLQLEPVPVSVGASISSARATPGVVPGTGVAPSLAVAEGRGRGGNSPPASLKSQKGVNLKAFKEWLERVERKPAPENTEAHQYQRKHAGPEEMLVSGGGQQVWADGVRKDQARLVEVKHVGNPDKSPFLPDSRCSEHVRLMILDGLRDEFGRYAAVINDSHTPAVGLQVIVNDSRAVPFLESLLKAFGIPGEVVVLP